MSKAKSARWHTVYSIISTLVEAGLIAVVVLWILPLFGLHIPPWGLGLILAGFFIFSYIMYLIGHPTVSNKPVNAPESIIGCEGTVEKDLDPEGYVKVAGELWKARAQGGGWLPKGTEVKVTDIAGLSLTVRAMKPGER